MLLDNHNATSSLIYTLTVKAFPSNGHGRVFIDPEETLARLLLANKTDTNTVQDKGTTSHKGVNPPVGVSIMPVQAC